MFAGGDETRKEKRDKQKGALQGSLILAIVREHVTNHCHVYSFCVVDCREGQDGDRQGEEDSD